MNMISRRDLALCALIFICSTAQITQASEGAFSFYLPGMVGDIAAAQSSEPGLQIANTLFIQSGTAKLAALQGKLNADIDLTLLLNIVGASYTFERKVLGASYSIGGAIPFGYAELEATVGVGPVSFSADRDSFDIGDIAIVPLQMSWNSGNLSMEFGHAIYVPTGGYDDDDVVNIGLNHWGFDTSLSTTYLNESTGTEFSVSPGILVNTTNKATHYRTGTEFHLDFTANQFLAKTFAIGLRGYYYRQLTGDSGSGAFLGDFKGKGVGLGPGFVWFPKFAKGKFTVLGKWIHDVSAKRRFDSNFGTITAAWTF